MVLRTRGAVVQPAAVALVLAVAALMLGRVVAVAASQSPRAQAIEKANKVLTAFSSAIQARVQSSMTQGGATLATIAYQAEVRQIAARLAREYRVDLGRTSIRVRNPLNTPRPWAKAVVARYAGKRAAVVRQQVVDLGDRYGVLRPIAMESSCVVCHGDPDVVVAKVGNALALAYPNDEAVGFAVGEVQGWLWVEVPKPEPIRSSR